MKKVNKPIWRWPLYVLSLLLLVTALPASADRVIASSRVANHLNIRQEANINSPIVGMLRPNDSLELISSVPYWYGVRLNDGTPGFVSKAWAITFSEAEQTGELIRLGAWNIKKLGHGDSTNFPLVAQVIEDNFDIVAVVEVMQKQSGHPGYDSLLTALGGAWAGLVTASPRPNTTAGHAEFYAVLYRVALVRPCEGWTDLVYHVDNDGSNSGTGSDHFSREPAFGCFEAPVNDTSVGVDFLLAAYHARARNGTLAEVSAEVAHVSDVFRAMAAARSGERDLVIGGDFNLVPAHLSQVVSARVGTQGTASTLNNQGQLSANLYDHLLVSNEDATTEMIDNPQVLDVRNVATSNRVFFQTVSDHLPIVVWVRTSGPDDD